MSNKNLFKEAIADAKAVREAALANAKVALEEALAPKLQSMLAAKLQEMEGEDEELKETKKSEEEKMKEGMYPDVTGDTIQDKYRATTGAALEETEELEEDFDLSEILAELNEAEEEEEEEEEAEETEKEGEEEVEVKDMTIEDLKDLIKDIVSQEMGDEAPEMDAEEPMDMEMGGEEMAADAGAEDEIDLEELLAELDSLDESDELAEAKKKKDKEEKEEKMKKMVKENQLDEYVGLDPDTTSQTLQSIANVIAAAGGIGALIMLAKDKFGVGSKEVKTLEKAAEKVGKKVDESSELEEAIETITTLRNDLNEVNLLNAKLLYVNKIFKAKNLTESQKVKVIASFDKATNVKEAKVVFESLQSALTAAPKKAIKESLGFASKAAGMAPNKTIVESNDVISRMQKLANIK